MLQHLLQGSLCLLLIFTGCLAGETPRSEEKDKSPSPPLFHTSSSPDIVVVDPDFERLTFDQFQEFQSDDNTWSTEGEVLICSGLPYGYLSTRKSFHNFTLRGEYQFVLTDEQKQRPNRTNTGFLIAIQEPHRVWPRSLEVQGQYGQMGSIRFNGGLPPVAFSDHPEVRERVRLPADQWNAIEITMRDGAITSRLNGEIVCTSQPAEILEGPIGLQAEGSVVRFRNLRVRRDSSMPIKEKPAR